MLVFYTITVTELHSSMVLFTNAIKLHEFNLVQNNDAWKLFFFL